MATAVLPPPSFLSEDPATRSFSPIPPPSRPSMEASSMKSRKSLLDIFVSGRRLAPAASGSKLKQSTKPAVNLAIPNPDEMKAAPNRDTHHKSPTAANPKPDALEQPAAKNALQRPRSKSRTILRAISTTFRSRSPVSPTSPPHPDVTSPQARQNREAALRERGLLPPKDLSRLEAEQDRNIPVVSLGQTKAEGDAVVEPSAADLIKRDWEAKNKQNAATLAPVDPTPTDERARMNSFRFGSQSPKPGELAQAPALEPVKEDQTPLPSPLSDDGIAPPPVPEKETPELGPSSLSAEPIPSDPSLNPPVSPLPTPPPTPSEPTNRSSPLISLSAAKPSAPSPLTIPLPPSPAPPGDVVSSKSAPPSEHNRSNSQKSSLSIPVTPVISLTPPAHASSTEELLPSPAPPSHRRSDSHPRMASISETASSLMTPSLETSSRTTATVSTVSTAESQGGVTGSAIPKGKSGLLKVKTPEHFNNIPMIIESPVEDVPVTELDVNPGEIPLPLSPVSEGHGQSLVVPAQTAPLTRRGRGLTDPGRSEKRKSFNPFRRAQSAEPDEPGAPGSSRMSFANLKRAASSLARPRSTYDGASIAPSSMSTGAKTYDASHLPPSPTLPSKWNLTPGAGAGVGGRTSVEFRQAPIRRPIQPTLHSRGSILMETNAIKDDETRRMTELAFLG